MYMVGAFSILRTTLFLTRTFVLVEPATLGIDGACTFDTNENGKHYAIRAI